MRSCEWPVRIGTASLSIALLRPRSKRVLMSLVFPAVLAGCARLSIRPQAIQPSGPVIAGRAIAAEPLPPTEMIVRDIEVSPSSVRENGSPFHRLFSLFRQGSPDEHRLELGRRAAASLSKQIVKRLSKLGFNAVEIPTDTDIEKPDDALLITGRLINANEGDRLTRVALGCGAGESSLDTEVHVFQLARGERAEVLAFTTHADSGKMPGVLPSLGAGELFIGTITVLAKAKSIAFSGEKVYSSQIDHLATRTGDEVGRYLSQYAAREGWIPWERAKSVKLAAE
jgi:Domain of unknown function (DUF4410)